jgi:hypothetical protein
LKGRTRIANTLAGAMRLSSIGLAFTLLAGCAEGVYEDFVLPEGGGLRDGKTSGSGGSGNTGATGGSGGSDNTGGTSTGGRGGSGATAGSGSTGGSGGSGATAGRGGTGGGAGTGGSAGRGGSSGSGGTSVDGGAGCPGTSDWMMGGTYAMGDKVRAVCSTASSGSGSTCTVGKTYAWSCSLALACGIVGPGTANWGLAWTLGIECN